MALRDDERATLRTIGLVVLGVVGMIGVVVTWWLYTLFRIDVPAGHVAVMTKKTGRDLDNTQLVAPSEEFKGLQLGLKTEGRYFVNPYVWDFAVYPMIEVPTGKMGVRTRLYGDDLPYGHFLATKETQKGVVEEVLRPGRYPINGVCRGQESGRKKQDYVEIIELHDPITVPAGYRGVVVNLAGPIPANPNTLLVEKGFRGVQPETLEAGTYYLNPFMYRVHQIDTRSQRFNLARGGDMGFPSKDGFWVSLDGIVEFRVKPEKAAEIFMIYNDTQNDNPDTGEAAIDDEIVRKIIMPNALSFCRLRGSNSTGREFIGGETRTAFQKDFYEAMKNACDPLGIEIVQALITKITPPDAIAEPVRNREVARQKLGQYREQKLQQDAEASLAREKATIAQRQALVAAQQEANKQVTAAKQAQQVAVTQANQAKAVAQRDLEAAKDQAAATLARKRAEAGIVDFQNQAEAAGWKKSVEAFGGDGEAFAKYVLYQKLAPAFKSIMSNTADSPLMEFFKNFNTPQTPRIPLGAGGPNPPVRQ